MTSSVLQLDLSHGQVAWCLAGGVEPSSIVLNQIRYLRQRGIPFASSEDGRGAGARKRYNFYQLMEAGVAFEWLKRRLEPRLLKNLVEARSRFRGLYKTAYLELAQNPKWAEGNPRERAIFADEILLIVDDRYSKTPGNMEWERTSGIAQDHDLGDLLQLFGGKEGGVAIPLKSLTQSLLRLAKIAPEIKPGPKH